MPPRLVHPAARLSRLPSELFLALPRRRAFTSSLALAARQQQQQQGQSSTAPSQAVPRLTLDLSGNALHRRHQGPFAMGTGMDSVVRQGSDRPWSELSVGSKGAVVVVSRPLASFTSLYLPCLRSLSSTQADLPPPLPLPSGARQLPVSPKRPPRSSSSRSAASFSSSSSRPSRPSSSRQTRQRPSLAGRSGCSRRATRCVLSPCPFLPFFDVWREGVFGLNLGA